jgi:hypothetical protein
MVHTKYATVKCLQYATPSIIRQIGTTRFPILRPFTAFYGLLRPFTAFYGLLGLLRPASPYLESAPHGLHHLTWKAPFTACITLPGKRLLRPASPYLESAPHGLHHLTWKAPLTACITLPGKRPSRPASPYLESAPHGLESAPHGLHHRGSPGCQRVSLISGRCGHHLSITRQQILFNILTAYTSDQ